MAETVSVQSDGHLEASSWGIGPSFVAKACRQLSDIQSTSVSSANTSVELQEILRSQFNNSVPRGGRGAGTRIIVGEQLLSIPWLSQ
jgi:hypothetical protein